MCVLRFSIFWKIFWNEKKTVTQLYSDRHVLSQLNDCGEGETTSFLSLVGLCVCVRFSKAQFNARGFPFWVEKYREKKTTKKSRLKKMSQLYQVVVPYRAALALYTAPTDQRRPSVIFFLFLDSLNYAPWRPILHSITFVPGCVYVERHSQSYDFFVLMIFHNMSHYISIYVQTNIDRFFLDQKKRESGV